MSGAEFLLHRTFRCASKYVVGYVQKKKWSFRIIHSEKPKYKWNISAPHFWLSQEYFVELYWFIVRFDELQKLSALLWLWKHSNAPKTPIFFPKNSVSLQSFVHNAHRNGTNRLEFSQIRSNRIFFQISNMQWING